MSLVVDQEGGRVKCLLLGALSKPVTKATKTTISDRALLCCNSGTVWHRHYNSNPAPHNIRTQRTSATPATTPLPCQRHCCAENGPALKSYLVSGGPKVSLSADGWGRGGKKIEQQQLRHSL